jgi:hypothetical protein
MNTVFRFGLKSDGRNKKYNTGNATHVSSVQYKLY